MQLEFGGQRIVIAAGEILIGSDVAATVRLDGDDVLPRHARVRRTETGAVVIEPGPTGGKVRVNGMSIGGDPTPLLHGDRIGIGVHEGVVVDLARAGATQVVSRAASAPPPRVASDVAQRPSPGPSEPTGRLVCLNDGREYQIAVVPFVLGRDATAEIVIASPDASRHHAEIVSRPDGEVVVDLSTNGTYVNGARVSGRHQLKALDVIRIGAEEFRYYPAPKTPAPPPQPPPGAEFRLSDTLIGLPKGPPAGLAPPKLAPPTARPLATMLVKTGTLKGQRFAVKTPVVNIGRAEFNDLRLPDPSISSTHVKLQLREGVWTLTDLGSMNGTTVDGEPVDDDMPLSPGAVLKLGEVSLSFEPQDERPVRADRTALVAAAAEAPPRPPQRLDPAIPPVPSASPRVVATPVPRSDGAANKWVMSVAIVVLLGLLAAVVFLV